MTLFGSLHATTPAFMPQQFNVPVPVSFKTPELALNSGLPTQKYECLRMPQIPFDPKLSNNGMFDTIDSAMLFIARHCLFHHQQFNRNLARVYLKKCRILDIVSVSYVTPSHLAGREFNSAFTAATRAIGSMH